MKPSESRDWILSELDGGNDYATGSDLSVGTDQNLSAWPSYRVYLLDLLYLVDPAAAVQKSRELVESSESPDEWAVALPNVAKSDEQEKSGDWLREKTEELFRNPTWRSDPSAGFLNAFDLIVFTERTDLSGELLELCEDLDQRALRHASFLALDRLVQIRPEVVMPVLAKSAKQLPGSGLMISNMMARADLRDSAQLDAVEQYLLDEARSAEELEGFASVFPNANFHVSNNLLTSTQGVPGMEIRERDGISLEVVEGWLEDGRFSHLHPPLRKVQSRLRGFLE